MGGYDINCAQKELATLEPPSGSTCISYLQSFISRHGGYLVNPDATSGCSFCPVRTTDQWFGPAFNMSYARHWRDLGFFVAYIIFNVGCLTCSVFMADKQHRCSWCSSSPICSASTLCQALSEVSTAVLWLAAVRLVLLEHSYSFLDTIGLPLRQMSCCRALICFLLMYTISLSGTNYLV